MDRIGQRSSDAFHSGDVSLLSVERKSLVRRLELARSVVCEAMDERSLLERLTSKSYRRALSRHSSAGRFAREIAGTPSELHASLGLCEPTLSATRVTKHVRLVERCECEPRVVAERLEDARRALGDLEVVRQGASVSEDVDVREEDARTFFETALIDRR